MRVDDHSGKGIPRHVLSSARLPLAVLLITAVCGCRSVSEPWHILVGGLALSAGGQIAPLAAALLHSAGTLIVVFNSARLVRAGETQE